MTFASYFKRNYFFSHVYDGNFKLLFHAAIVFFVRSEIASIHFFTTNG